MSVETAASGKIVLDVTFLGTGNLLWHHILWRTWGGRGRPGASTVMRPSVLWGVPLNDDDDDDDDDDASPLSPSVYLLPFSSYFDGLIRDIHAYTRSRTVALSSSLVLRKARA